MTNAFRGLRGPLLIVSALATTILGPPWTAEAAVVSRDGDSLIVSEDVPGIGGSDVLQSNHILVTYDAAADEYVVTDSGGTNPTTPLLTLQPCDPPSGNTVRCPEAGIRSIEITIGDLRDVVHLDSLTLNHPDLPAALTSTVSGGNGNDDLHGLDGRADTLDGDTDDDKLFGHAGNDTLHGGQGRDALDAGAGDDILRGGANADVFDGNDGSDTVDYSSDGTSGVYAAIGEDNSSGLGCGGAPEACEGDHVRSTVENLTGTPGADVLKGSPAANVLQGLGGADRLQGREAADVISGGGDSGDVVDYTDRATAPGMGDDVRVDLGAGTAVSGGTPDGEPGSRDTITGVANAESGGGDDVLLGTAGSNRLAGGAGDDRLDPGGESAMPVADVLVGGPGARDLADYSARPADDALVITLDGSANDGESGENDHLHADVEDVSTGAGADTVTGSASSANLIKTSGGADTVTTADATADGVDCGAGADTATADHRDALGECETTTLTSRAQLAVSDAQVTEGTGGTISLVFTVSVDAPAGRPVSFDYTTTPGSASEGVDYADRDGSGTIPAGSSQTTVSVSVVADDVDEDDETMTLTISNPSDNAAVPGGGAHGTGTILDDDGTPVASIGGESIDEGDRGEASLSLPVTLSHPSSREITIEYSTSEVSGGAAAGSDYAPVGDGTVTIPAGQTTGAARVTVIGDVVDEDDETFEVTLSSPADATIGTAKGIATILDDDDAPALSISDGSVDEGDAGTRTLAFTVTLGARSGKTVTVDYATSGGTATRGVDFAAAAGTVTFAPGETSQTVGVTVIGDTRPEVDETFTIELSDPSNATIARRTGTGTIADDDDAGIRVADTTVSEGDSGTRTATFTVTLSPVSDRTATVDYATADGTATAPGDYEPAAGTLTFAPGDTSETVAVAVRGDAVDEGDETFTLTLRDATGARIDDDAGIARIVDDEPSPSLTVGDVTIDEGNSGTTGATFTITQSAVSRRDVTVEYTTSDGTAVAGSDYTGTSGTAIIPNGQTTAEVTVPVVGDLVHESDETFLLTLGEAANASVADGSATGTIADDEATPSLSLSDAEVDEGDDATFAVTLSGASDGPIAVEYATADGTATAGSDYSAASDVLTIPAGQTRRTITVPVAEDAVDEEDETFALTLSKPSGAVVDDGSATGTIADDDGEPSLSVDDVTVDEADDARFTFTLSTPSGRAVELQYATADGTAGAGTDYTAVADALTIPAGKTSRTITVPVADDAVDESDETFTLSLSDAANATIADGTATGTITDDEGVPALALSGGEVTEGDAGSRDLAFTVAQSGASSSDVTVRYATVDGTAKAGEDYAATTGTLRIEAGATSGVIEVPVSGDMAVEGDEAFSLVISQPASATIAEGHDTATGSIEDDDQPVTQPAAVPVVEVGDLRVAEGDTALTAAVFTFSLSAPSTQAVSVKYVTSDGTATSGSDFGLTAGTLTFAAGERSRTVSVPIIGDRVDEADETFALVLIDPQGATLAKDAAAVTIADDDSSRPAPKVSFKTTPTRDRELPFRFVTRGRVQIPTGMRKSEACAGKVQIRFKAGKRTISTSRVELRGDCTFSRGVSFGARSRLRPGRLRVDVRFLGNASLAPKSAASRRLRVG